jgi:hypothetical protein
MRGDDIRLIVRSQLKVFQSKVVKKLMQKEVNNA